MAENEIPASDANPFIAYRHLLDGHQRALSAGLADTDYVALVAEADAAVAAVDGRGFMTTPIVELQFGADEAGPGPVVAKVETANVSGSHKARHLFGLLLDLLVDERVSGRGDGPQPEAAPLAIASCGNAALGAAVVARSAGRTLRVFVPTDADRVVLDRLDALGAQVEICHRVEGRAGDPCLDGLLTALDEGAVPFTVQSTMAPGVIDGGRTLGLELADQLDALGVQPAALYIQIGGGALATAVMDGLARRWPGRSLPRLHPVQARSAHPYVAGWRRIGPALLADLGVNDPSSRAAADRLDEDLAAALGAHRGRLDLPAALARQAPRMTAWPSTPVSIASGILDDVTYDWSTVMAHQIATGGWPILVEEDTFVTARKLAANQVDPPPDETGAAGLAGLLQHRAADPARAVEPAVVLLTGVARS